VRGLFPGRSAPPETLDRGKEITLAEDANGLHERLPGSHHERSSWLGFSEPISSLSRLSGPVILQDGDGLDEVAGLGGAAPEFP
jgi:hypothetical protein